MYTIIDLISSIVHRLIPHHVGHLHLTYCGSQVNADVHVNFAQRSRVMVQNF